ncbi:MAG: FtsX-like permease family protein [Pseudomonadota bacterium]
MKRVSWRIAARELAGGLRGFWIYLACLALGAAAIAAAGSVTEVFTRGLDSQARTLLGGDLMFTAAQRRADAEERAFVESLGEVTETAGVDLMGAAGALRRQVDVRAVDSNYPLIGAVTLSGGEDDLQNALALRDGKWGAAVSQSLLDQFGVEVGDSIEIGPVRAEIRARLDAEPDRLGTPGGFGPQALIHLDGLVEAGRLTPGQLFRSGFRVALAPGQSADAVKGRFEEEFGESSLSLRGPEDAVDGLQEVLETFNNFLAIIGIASLVAGGVGVAQATSSFLATRIESIAALKALGADAGTVRDAYLLQLGALAAIGTLAGVALGAAAPFALAAFAGDRIPLPQALGVYPVPLARAAALGMLAAAVFALPAIGRARATRPAALFRSTSERSGAKTPWLERSAALAAAALLAAVAILSSSQPGLTLALLLGAVAAWGLFIAVGHGVRLAAGVAARGATGLRRLTLANLGGPGSLAPTIVPALGLGLALLTLVTSVQANLVRQLTVTAAASAPSLVFTQIPNDGAQTFDQVLAAEGVDIEDPDMFRRAPFLLARVVALKGEPLDVSEVAPSERWVVDGETSLTYLAKQPPEAELTEGAWWAEDYRGPLLVSVEAEAARGIGVGVGDTIGFRVFGRDVTAEVASLRKVDWGTFGIGSNTAFVLSPGELEAARPYHVAIARTSIEAEERIINALGADLPDVVVFQTRPALATAARLFGNVAVAVNAAAGIVTVAGLLVLLGAFAAMARKRRSEAALLKTFGAPRGSVLALYAGEFALAGGAGAVLGAALGVGAAYPIVVQIFEAEWSFPWREALGVIGLAVGVSALGGAGVGAATMAHPPMRVLRSG